MVVVLRWRLHKLRMRLARSRLVPVRLGRGLLLVALHGLLSSTVVRLELTRLLLGLAVGLRLRMDAILTRLHHGWHVLVERTLTPCHSSRRLLLLLLARVLFLHHLNPVLSEELSAHNVVLTSLVLSVKSGHQLLLEATASFSSLSDLHGVARVGLDFIEEFFTILLNITSL